MDDGEWRFVSRRRNGAKTDRNCHKTSQTFAPSFARYNGRSSNSAPQGRDEQKGMAASQRKTAATPIVTVIERLREQIELSDFWEEIQSNLAKAVHAELQWLHHQSNTDCSTQPEYVQNGIPERSRSRGPWEHDNGVAYSLVCLGLGSPTECNDVMSCRYQLALALLLQRLLKIPSSRVHISDPVMNVADLLVLDALSLSSNNEPGASEPASPSDQQDVEIVVYLAPHCDADLYGDILGLELALQPFCSSCFSCAYPFSWKYGGAEANNGISSSNKPFGSCTGPRGFVLIANVLSSYEMRRSLFGELHLDESPTTTSGRPQSESVQDCLGSVAADESPGGLCGGPVLAVGKEADVQAHPCELLKAVHERIERDQCEVQSDADYAVRDETPPCHKGAPEAADCRACADGTTIWNCGASATANGERRAICHWVAPSRGAFLLLELLPFVSEWPLQRPFPAYPPAFNDLAISRFPSPRTEMQRAAFWKDVMKSLSSVRQQPKNQRHRRRTGKRSEQRET